MERSARGGLHGADGTHYECCPIVPQSVATGINCHIIWSSRVEPCSPIA